MGALGEGWGEHQDAKGWCGLRKDESQCPLHYRQVQCLMGRCGQCPFPPCFLCSNCGFLPADLVLNHSLQVVMKKIVRELFCYRKELFSPRYLVLQSLSPFFLPIQETKELRFELESHKAVSEAFSLCSTPTLSVWNYTFF